MVKELISAQQAVIRDYLHTIMSYFPLEYKTSLNLHCYVAKLYVLMNSLSDLTYIILLVFVVEKMGFMSTIP